MIRMKTLSWFVFVLCALSAAGKVFIAQVGHKIVLDCGVGTFQNNLVWNHGRDLLWRHFSNGFTSKGGKETVSRSKVVEQTSLEISRVKEEDAGVFTCQKDSAKQQHTLAVVSVSVDPPGPLQEASQATLTCKVNGPSQSSTVEWKKPDGSKVQSKAVHLERVDVSHKGTWTCKVTYEGEKLDANINVQVTVPETTTESSSENSKTTSSDVGNSDHSVELLGLNWWVWVAVGLGCLVVIVLIISVVATCKKVRRRKRRLQKMKNAQLQHRPKTYCQCESKTAAAKPQQGRRREKPSAPPLQPLLKE